VLVSLCTYENADDLPNATNTSKYSPLFTI